MAGSIRDLDDDQLLKRADRLLRDDRARTAELLRHIHEIDRRDLWARQGYSSLFAFCLGRWNMSEHEAYNRIGAARAGAVFPVIFDMVARASSI